MIHTTLLRIAMAASCGAMVSALVHGDVRVARSGSRLSLNETCQEIASSVSMASNVYYNGSTNYTQDISHWASSSNQNAACSFQPGTPEDVGVALHILGRTRTPFAVKGGGHATNPGFSSTLGVQIAMSRFSNVDYDPETQTASIGAGLIWGDVYTALEPHGVNVLGGRISSVGVAGFTLGGAFELVAPNGTVMNVTQTSSPDLFFALTGGGNDFGIVTSFTLKTFPQTEVWGGVIYYLPNSVDQVISATANFSANCTDPKAEIIVPYNRLFGLPNTVAILFYDAPTLPPGIFDEFLAISSVRKDLSTRSFSSFVRSIPVTPSGLRAVFNTVSLVNYSTTILQSIVNESVYWAQNLLRDASFISYSVEPFLPTIFAHNITPTAYPPDRTIGLSPVNIYYSSNSVESDQAIYDAIRLSAQKLKADAIESGQDVANASLYSNYAIFDTPLADMYGASLPRLRAIHAAVDPDDVMGLAGGWKF